MAIAFRAYTIQGGYGIEREATKPTGTVINDVMVALVGHDPNVAGTSVTQPAGWTQSGSTTTGKMHGYVYYKVATGAEPSIYTFITSYATDTVIVLASFSGTESTDPVLVDATWYQQSSLGKTHIAPSIYFPSPTGLLLCGFISQNSGDFTVPAGMTELADGHPTPWTVVALDSQDYASTGNTGIRQAVHSVTDYRLSMSMALRTSGDVIPPDEYNPSSAARVLMDDYAPFDTGLGADTTEDRWRAMVRRMKY